MTDEVGKRRDGEGARDLHALTPLFWPELTEMPSDTHKEILLTDQWDNANQVIPVDR